MNKRTPLTNGRSFIISDHQNKSGFLGGFLFLVECKEGSQVLCGFEEELDGWLSSARDCCIKSINKSRPKT